MVLLIIIPFLNGYFIGNIPNIFRQTHISSPNIFTEIRADHLGLRLHDRGGGENLLPRSPQAAVQVAGEGLRKRGQVKRISLNLAEMWLVTCTLHIYIYIYIRITYIYIYILYIYTHTIYLYIYTHIHIIYIHIIYIYILYIHIHIIYMYRHILYI